MARTRALSLFLASVLCAGIAIQSPLFPLVHTSALEPIVNLSSDDGTSSAPQISSSGNNVYVVWQDDSSGVFNIIFSASADNGETFARPISLSASEGFSSNPQIASDGANVYVVWQDSSGENNSIFFAYSLDNGEDFSDPVVLSPDNATSSSPQISASGNNVYVVWQQSSPSGDDIMLATSADAGVTFSDETNLSNDAGESVIPEIAASGNNVYVVWQDDNSGDFDIMLATSSDNGQSFGNTVNVSNNTGSSVNPRIAASNNAYVVWQDDDSGDFDVMVSSVLSGESPSEPVNLSGNDGFSTSPEVATSGERAYVVWSDESDTGSGFDVLLSSTSDGETFSSPLNISNNQGLSSSPSVAISGTGDRVYALWSDNELGETNDEVLLSASADLGGSFGCPINLSTNSGSSSMERAALAGDGIKLHVVWQDTTPGNFEILARGNIDALSQIITIDPVANTTPKWDGEAIEVSGRVSNEAAGDIVSVDWGDGSTTDAVEIDGCSWGPVSHSYDSSSVNSNPNLIVARLKSDESEIKASSEPLEITVQKHSTNLSLDAIPSVTQGENVTLAGSLVDAEGGSPIAEMPISFVGSGAVSDMVYTDASGAFSIIGASLGSAHDGLEVQAHFEGNTVYEPSDSEVRTYSTIDAQATEFDVPAGTGVMVALNGTNASIAFEEILDGGPLFVSHCDSPENNRMIPVDDSCLKLSPGFQMADGTSAVITISLDGTELSGNQTLQDIDIYHIIAASDGAVINDITKSRDLGNGTIQGVVTGFSDFALGVPIREEASLGHYRTQVFVGDGNVVSLRDISSQGNSSSTAVISFDKDSYKLTDEPKLTIRDSNGNVNSGSIDMIYAGIKSDTSDPFVIWVTLVETGADTGIFKGSFSFTKGDSSTEDRRLQAKEGDRLAVLYVSGARLEAAIDGVGESGEVDVSDYVVEDGVCFAPIGGAVDLQFVDSSLGEEGMIQVRMSYSNALLGTNDPSSLRIVHKEDSTWIDITAGLDAYDPDSMTITGEAITGGPFSLATNVGDCGGGAGGGFGFGRGVVVDFIAPLAGRDSGGGGGNGHSTQAGSASSPVSSGQDVAAGASIESKNVEVRFEQVDSSSGALVVRMLKLDDFREHFSQVNVGQGRDRGTLILDNSEFSTAGNLFDIDASSIQHVGKTVVTIPYDEDAVHELGSESDIRLLHFDSEAGLWTDDTSVVDIEANTVSGILTSLSPVVAAVVNDGTFDDKYFDSDPLAKIVAQGENPVRALDMGGNPVGTATLGQELAIVSTFKNLERNIQNYTAIVEVLDSQGIAASIIVKDGVLGQGELSDIQFDWSAYSVGTFTFKVIVVNGLEDPVLLSRVSELSLVVA